MLLSYCGYLSLMHCSFVRRHDAVLAAAEVALHVEKEVKATGKSTSNSLSILIKCCMHTQLRRCCWHAQTIACNPQCKVKLPHKPSSNSPLPIDDLDLPSMLFCYHCCTSQQHVWLRVAAVAGRGTRYCRHNRCMACALQQYQLCTKGSSH